MAKKQPNPLNILDRYRGNDFRGILHDPGAYHTPGELFMIGDAYKRIGEILMNFGKEQTVDIMVSGRYHDPETNTLFVQKEGGVRYTVDSTKIKQLFPREASPDLYKESRYAGSITAYKDRSPD